MATRKIKDAKDLTTNELIYFKGHAKATFMSDGRTVEEAIRTAGGSATGSTTGGSKEWKCVVDRRMAVGEKNLSFSTYADGTPLKAEEAVVQIVIDQQATTGTNGYISIESTNNKTASLFGIVYYEFATIDKISFVSQAKFKASPFYMVAEISAGSKTQVAQGETIKALLGNQNPPQVYEDITCIKLSPNSAIASAPPLIKIYAR